MNTAVITGGAGGMGLATAKLLGVDHRIVIADLGQDRIDAAVKELTGLGIAASGVVCDVTDEQSVHELMLAAASEGNRVRTVVHTAGVSPQMGKPDLIVRINALGTVNVAKAFLPLAQEGDALVNVASYAGHALPGILIPTRAFPLAESDPARFVRALVRRAGIVGRKRHAGFAYALSKTYVIWYSETDRRALRRARGPSRVGLPRKLRHRNGSTRSGPRSSRPPQGRRPQALRDLGGDRCSPRLLCRRSTRIPHRH